MRALWAIMVVIAPRTDSGRGAEGAAAGAQGGDDVGFVQLVAFLGPVAPGHGQHALEEFVVGGGGPALPEFGGVGVEQAQAAHLGGVGGACGGGFELGGNLLGEHPADGPADQVYLGQAPGADVGDHECGGGA